MDKFPALVVAFLFLLSEVVSVPASDGEKIGRCPTARLLESGQCVDNLLNECTTDSDCAGSAKCCSTGCKLACVLPDLSTCQRIQVEYQKRARALGVSEDTLAPPRCLPEGKFEPVQCNGTACWCVDNSGFEVAGTRARSLDLIDCKNPRPCAAFNCRMLCPYEFELDTDGCPLCRCRDPCKGIKCPGSQSCQLETVPCEKEPCAPVPTCKQARALDSLCPLGLPMTLPGGEKPYLCGKETGKPQCPKEFDCHVTAGADYGVCCASLERLTKPGSCPVSTGGGECGVPCSNDLECTGADKCCSSTGCGKMCLPPQNLTVCRQQQAFTELLNLHERGSRGYVPQCDSDGQFKSRQCSTNGLVCWCVDPYSGAQVRGSIGPAQGVRCDAAAEMNAETSRSDCGVSACQRTCQYGYKTDETGCQLCECEDPCMNFKCQDGFRCEKVPEEGCDGRQCPVKPVCKEVFVEPCSQGPHLRNSVTDQPVRCTVGSKFSCPSAYNCVMSLMHNATFCCPKREEDVKEKANVEAMPTVCQVMRQLQESKERSLEKNGLELPMKNPKCTPSGEFDSLQCDEGSCWCVDEFGIEVPKTRGPNTGSRDCKKSRNDVDCEGASMCRLGCDFGFVIDTDSGCPKCECRDPCDTLKCSEGKICQIVQAPCEQGDCPRLPFCVDSTKRSSEDESDDEDVVFLSCPGGDVKGKLRTCKVRGRSLDCPQGHGCYSNSTAEGSSGICCPLTGEIPTKPGQCPFVTNSTSSCDIGCATDLDCEASNKCCSNGCGTQCSAPLLKTGCQLERDLISYRSKESNIPPNRVYLPDCDSEGRYNRIQCHPGSRICWCVDDLGKELAGTRMPPGIKPTCDDLVRKEVCEALECDLDCTYGYALDTAGCPVCKCKNPCEKIRCGENENCKMMKLSCVSEPCPDLPVCIPRKEKPCLYGKPLEAPNGQNVQCGPFGESCPSSHRCQLNQFGESAVCCPKPREVCTELVDAGNCNFTLTRWHFNTKSNRCEQFTYTGCGGNLNNFELEKDCRTACPVLTSCEKLREKNLRLIEKYKKVVFLPKCKEGGEFETVQCLEELGICWCVDKHGEAVKGTLTRGKPVCSVRQARQHSVEKTICDEGVTAHVCDKSLCKDKVCIADPNAVCKINPCGGCKIEFYDARGNTVNCASGLSPCQSQLQEIVNSPNWYHQDLEYPQNREAEILPNFYTDVLRMHLSLDDVEKSAVKKPRQKRQTMIDLSDIDDHLLDLMAMETQESHGPQILTLDGKKRDESEEVQAVPEFILEAPINGRIPYVGDAIKAGECPAVRQPSFLRLLAQVANQCVDRCVSDADCPGPLRCCPGQCGQACQLPILPKAPITKPGQCPYSTSVCKDQSQKLPYCRRDWDCPLSAKCCETECGNVCVEPEVESEVSPFFFRLVPPRCTESGEFSSEQRQGDLAWCVDPNGSPVQGSLTRGFVRCAQNGTLLERLPLGPVCPSPDQAPKICTTECLQASCPGHANVVCVADPCNGCKTSFYTLEGDEVTCEPVCSQKVKVGKCRSNLLRWAFDPITHQCEEFFYGGCGGNDNNFQSLDECQETCKSVDRCSLPKNVGTCGKQVNRWFYNPAEHKCEEFVYTGCGGNANNFLTKAECEMVCPDLVMCPRLPDSEGELSVCSRSEVCELEGCPDEDAVCTVDPCTCSPVFKNRQGEKITCHREHEENFLADAPISAPLPQRLEIPAMRIIPAEVVTETAEEKLVRDMSKKIESEVIRMHNPAQEFIARSATKGTTEKPLKKKKPKAMDFAEMKTVTRCQKMREKMVEEKSSFVVDCDKHGGFAPTQCYMGTPSVCWCVDESGNQLKDTTLFMSGNRTCHYVPVKAVNVSLAIPMAGADQPEAGVVQKEIDSMLNKLNAEIEEIAAEMSSEQVRVNFTLVGENKIDVADFIEEMVRNGDFQLTMGDEVMPADFTSSRFVHVSGSPVIRQQRKLNYDNLDNREIIAEPLDNEIPYFAIVVTMCVVSSVVICALIISLLLYRKKTTGEYPKGGGVPLAYGSYPNGVNREDVVPRGFPRVGLDEKDFATIKTKPLSPVLPRFMRNGNTESMKL